jgi:BirA family transcriptional regulator, biotin operon repressor / biotin---[acetyl-CoA-carboxylase] ligase
MSGFAIDRTAASLADGEIHWLLHYEPVCDSTQQLARIAAAAGAAQGWTVVTDEQRQGRGRQGRSWLAPAEEALLVSTILQPPVDVLPLLPLLAGIAVVGGIEVTTGAQPALKWPNDVMLNGKKLAGILLEHPPGPSVILGIGLNVNQSVANLPAEATSLALELRHPVERETLLAAILNDFGNAYERADREGVDWIVPGWRSRGSMLGTPIQFRRDGVMVRGVAEDIDASGALVVRMADGRRVTVVAGEVEQIRAD